MMDAPRKPKPRRKAAGSPVTHGGVTLRQVSITLDPDLFAAVGRVADAGGMTFVKAVQKILAAGIAEVEVDQEIAKFMRKFP